MSEADSVRSGPGFGRARIIWLVVSLSGVAAILWFVLPQVADFSKVRAAVGNMTGLELALLAIVAAWNLVTYWIVIVAATPGLRYRQAAVLIESATAVANTVPGGGAIAVGLTYAILGACGFSKSRSTLSVIVSGRWNNF